jgi:hypothetical protein
MQLKEGTYLSAKPADEGGSIAADVIAKDKAAGGTPTTQNNKGEGQGM